MPSLEAFWAYLSVEPPEQFSFWLLVLGLLFANILFIPLIICLIPHDYFKLTDGRMTKAPQFRFSVRWLLWHCLKNFCGLICLLCGLVMLVLPGPGILTILLSVILLDFPKKQYIERYLIIRWRLLQPLNQLRRRFGRTPLEL